MKNFIGTTTLAVAIIISAIAGYFSIVGLAALFAARTIPVIIMGSALEVGKIVAATWLKLNWKNKTVSIAHKGYLLFATLMLMAITSLGIFGFLSAGHLEQNAPLAGLSIQQQQYQTQLDQATANNKRIETRLAQIDNNINAFLTNGAASKGLKASSALKAERVELQSQMDNNYKSINDLNTKLAPLKHQATEVQAKLGPIKFAAEALGYKDPEVAVRIIIMMIMSAFDPLAVILIISAMATFAQRNDPAEPVSEPVQEPVVEQVVDEPESVIEPVVANGSVSIDVIPVIEADASEPVAPVAQLSPVEIADMMASHTTKVETKPNDLRTTLIDMLEQYPEIVTDLLTAAKEMESKDNNVDFTTTTKFTGAIDE